MEARWLRRRGGIVAAAGVALGALLLPTGVAYAAPADDDVDALLEVVDAVEADVTAVGAGESLNVDEAAGEIEVVLADDSGSSVFVEPNPDAERGAGPTIYSVIEGHQEAEQSFDFVVDGEPAVLEVEELGKSEFILVSSAVTGEVVNMVLPAWAEDARGRDVDTEYEVEGGTLTQVVDTRGAAFPVVADPALACNWVHCTIQYNKYETRQMSLYGGFVTTAVAGACTLLTLSPVAGVACGVATSLVMSVANDARSRGRCIGMQALIAPIISFPYPVIYTGGNCR